MFKPPPRAVARPAGESDEDSDEDDLDMSGFKKHKRNILRPVQVNGNENNDGQRNYDEEDWGEEPYPDSNPPPPAPRIENWGQTPKEEIRLSCVRGNLDRLKSSLLKETVGVDDFFSDDYTPLMTAAANGHPQLVEFLISQKANVDLYDHKSKTTALMAAVSAPNHVSEKDVLECVQLLIKGNADVNIQDKFGVSALGIAVKRRRINVIRYLLYEGEANPNLIDSDGRTCLFHSAEIGDGKVCRLLLEKGADVEIVDDSGWSAPELTNDKGFYRLAELLHIVRDTKWQPGLNPTLMQEIDKDAALRRLKTPVADGVTVREDSQIEILLGSFNAQKYIENFRKHRITFLQFLELDEEQLREMGIDELGVRKKLVDHIREIHNQEWQASSIRTVAVNKKITAAEAVCMVNNIKLHIQHISKSLLSMRNRIKKDPKCLQYGKERNKLKDLILLCKEMKNSNKALEEEVIELIQYLHSIEENAEFKLGDEVKLRSIEEVAKMAEGNINQNNFSRYKWILGCGVGLVILLASSSRIRNFFRPSR